MRPKHGLLLFITSCMSGCGQMYQGYMKRGISLLLGFFVILAVAGFLGLSVVAFFLPVVWLYAFFDSYNLRGRIADGSAPPDEYLFGLSEMDSRRMTELLRRRHSVIGWGLVALGVYLLYDIVLVRLSWVIPGWFYNLLRYDVPRVVLTVLVMALGVWFIRGPKARDGQEDIPDFVPPVQNDEAADREQPDGAEADHDGGQ